MTEPGHEATDLRRTLSTLLDSGSPISAGDVTRSVLYSTQGTATTRVRSPLTRRNVLIRFAIAAMMIGLVSVGIVLSTSGHSGSPRSTRPSTAPSTAALTQGTSGTTGTGSAATCAVGSLSASINMLPSDTHAFDVAVVIRNDGSTACSLSGFPTVSVYDETAKSAEVDEQISQNNPATFGPGFSPSTGTSDPIVVGADQSAVVYFQTTTAANIPSCNDLQEPTLTFSGWNAGLTVTEGLPTCPGSSFVVSAVGLEGSSIFPAPTGSTMPLPPLVTSTTSAP